MVVVHIYLHTWFTHSLTNKQGKHASLQYTSMYTHTSQDENSATCKLK